jgi:hypothetical protein
MPQKVAFCLGYSVVFEIVIRPKLFPCFSNPLWETMPTFPAGYPVLVFAHRDRIRFAGRLNNSNDPSGC